MMQFRKYLISIFFICLAAMPGILAVQFIINQQLAAHKVTEQLEKGNYKTYTFNQQQVQWVNPGEELLVNGKLFDVKSYHENKGDITLTGIFDEEEEYLLDKYNNLVNKKNGTAAQDFSFLKIFLTPYITTAVGYLQQPVSFTIVTDYCCFNEQAIQQAYSIITPPPQQPAV
jgi:hypothetical protein